MEQMNQFEQDAIQNDFCNEDIEGVHLDYFAPRQINTDFSIDNIDYFENYDNIEDNSLVLDSSEESYSQSSKDLGESEEEIVAKFKILQCCENNCINRFDIEELINYRLYAKNLDYYSTVGNLLNLTILGFIQTMAKTKETSHARYIKDNGRVRIRMNFQLRGEMICKELFLFAYNISGNRLKFLKKWYAENGLTIQPHGNSKNLPFNTLSVDDRKLIVSYIKNYAEKNALYMPGSSPYQKDIVKFLPSQETKKNVYDLYASSCFESEMKPVHYTTFVSTWNIFCPDILIQRPRTDLCLKCQQFPQKAIQIRGGTEEEKINFFKACQNHLDEVALERRNYFDEINLSRQYFSDKCIDSQATQSHCGYDGVVHYSFDFAQQVHLPSSSQQSGPLYFLAPLKVGLFGVMNDTTKIQGNFLIPESVSVSKGANAVVSYLNYFIESHGLGEKKIFAHADNCTAQNKNHTVIFYMVWRVLNKFNEFIKLSFLPVGHTKFNPDWAFGLIKKKFARSDANCLDDLCRIVSGSTPNSGINVPILTGNEKGDVIIDVFDWAEFFKSLGMSRIDKILQYQHFETSINNPGIIFAKKHLDDNPTIFKICEPDVIKSNKFPKIIHPKGLSEERKKYLFNKIRPLVNDNCKDVLCPPI